MKWTAEFGLLVSHVANLHVKQTRKGPQGAFLRIPYVIHPLQVLQRVKRWGIHEANEQNKDLWKAVLFHDSIEDTTANYEHLIGLIGKASADIVLELTHFVDEDAQDYMSSFCEKSVASLVAKIADRLCNVEDFFLDSPDYALKYFHKADQIFETYNSRKEEVRSTFGDNTVLAIDTDIKDVLERISS